MTIRYTKNGQEMPPVFIADVGETLAAEMRHALTSGQIERVEILDDDGADITNLYAL
jgi:hypothetical protein